MFTPEDDLDRLEDEIAIAERALERHHTTPPYLIENEEQFFAKGVRLQARLDDLRWARKQRVQELTGVTFLTAVLWCVAVWFSLVLAAAWVIG